MEIRLHTYILFCWRSRWDKNLADNDNPQQSWIQISNAKAGFLFSIQSWYFDRNSIQRTHFEVKIEINLSVMSFQKLWWNPKKFATCGVINHLKEKDMIGNRHSQLSDAEIYVVHMRHCFVAAAKSDGCKIWLSFENWRIKSTSNLWTIITMFYVRVLAKMKFLIVWILAVT